MLQADTIDQVQSALRGVRGQNRRIGFVPTMGALHKGHRSLIEIAREQCDTVVVSIFVNPTQFGPDEDFDRYPRTMDTDLTVCRDANVDVVFTPTAAEIYPAGCTTTVRVAKLTEHLCGAHRPGHFDGVTTVVSKLFNIVQPNSAYFGEKDFQQLRVIERMTRDLCMPIEIVGCPTVREDDGLAVSSRNVGLSPEHRAMAACLYDALQTAATTIRSGADQPGEVIAETESRIRRVGVSEIEYISIVDPDTLENVDVLRGPVRICVAVKIGGCRLIDNIAVDASRASG
jgi:pantoate--beta-alanine ligase